MDRWFCRSFVTNYIANYNPLVNYSCHDTCFKLDFSENNEHKEHYKQGRDYYELCSGNGDRSDGPKIWTVWRQWVDRGNGLCCWKHLHLFESILFAVSISCLGSFLSRWIGWERPLILARLMSRSQKYTRPVLPD
jgi:hypothetical protein